MWTDDGDKADVRSSYAKDSDGFTPPGVVAENVRAYHLRVSTAGDAGGVVVWDDNNDQGKVYAAPIPVGGVVPDTDPPSEPPTSVGGFKPPKNTQKCTTSVTIKSGVVAAVQGGGCFDEAPKNVWTTIGDVNVNGIRFVGSKASTKVTIDTSEHTITCHGRCGAEQPGRSSSPRTPAPGTSTARRPSRASRSTASSSSTSRRWARRR